MITPESTRNIPGIGHCHIFCIPAPDPAQQAEAEVAHLAHPQRRLVLYRWGFVTLHRPASYSIMRSLSLNASPPYNINISLTAECRLEYLPND